MSTTKNIHQKINVRANVAQRRLNDGFEPSKRLVQLPYNRDFDYWKTAPYIQITNSRNYLREDII